MSHRGERAALHGFSHVVITRTILEGGSLGKRNFLRFSRYNRVSLFESEMQFEIGQENMRLSRQFD